MGWLKRLTGRLSKSSEDPACSNLSELIDTSWSGKTGNRYFEPHDAGEGPARRAPQQRTSTLEHRRGPGRPPAAAAQRRAAAAQRTDDSRPAAAGAANPVDCCGAAGTLGDQLPPGQARLDVSCHAAAEGQPPSPSPAMHRSGSVPCTITVAKQHLQKEAAADSASSLHAGSGSGEGHAAGKGPAAAAAAASEPVTPLHPPCPQQQHDLHHTARGQQQHQQQRQRGTRHVPHGGSTLSAALLEQGQAGVGGAAAESAEAQAQGRQGTDSTSPEKPSTAILATLSRSLPTSREPSVHGGTAAAGLRMPRVASAAALREALADELQQAQQQLLPQQPQQPQQQSQQPPKQQPPQQLRRQAGREGRAACEEEERGGGSTPSGSGRPATAPLPCSREGSQHHATGYADLASLPPGLSAEDEGGGLLGPRSLPARTSESQICSPGAVSLLSLQLRGASAAGSMPASREGSFRPLRRQLSAGGLSAALSRDASLRAGTNLANLNRDSAPWSPGQPARSREPSLRGGVPLDREGSGAWPQLPPHLGLSREGSNRGGQQSREGSSRGWALLHPVAESGPYQGAPLPQPRFQEGGSWTQRITSYPAGAGAGAAPAAPGGGVDGGPSRDRSHRGRPESASSRDRSSRGSRRHVPETKEQQRYAVDATQLSVALCALALKQPDTPGSASPPPPRAKMEAAPAPIEAPLEAGCEDSMPSSSMGGSSVFGKKSVLVGDPEWATGEGGAAWEGGVASGAAPQHGGKLAGGCEGGGEEGGGESGPSGEKGPMQQQQQQGEHKVEWNRRFIRRWKAVKKRARLQGMGLRSLWKVNSPTDRHEPDELLVNLPQNDLAWPRFWSPPASGGMPIRRSHGSRADIRRDPSLSTMLLGEVAEVT